MFLFEHNSENLPSDGGSSLGGIKHLLFSMPDKNNDLVWMGNFEHSQYWLFSFMFEENGYGTVIVNMLNGEVGYIYGR